MRPADGSKIGESISLKSDRFPSMILVEMLWPAKTRPWKELSGLTLSVRRRYLEQGKLLFGGDGSLGGQASGLLHKEARSQQWGQVLCCKEAVDVAPDPLAHTLTPCQRPPGLPAWRLPGPASPAAAPAR